MKIQCDACESAPATVICCADEAALCARCDVEIHAANRLASKHQRLPLESLSNKLPKCDVCQEKAAFIFCVEDRALFCRDCDEPIHVPGTLTGNHQRYLATGIRVGFVAQCHKDLPDGGCFEPPQNQSSSVIAPKPPLPPPAAAQQPPSPPFLPAAWAVDEFLQLSDYETTDKASCFETQMLQKESPLGIKELEWFADIDVFNDQVPNSAVRANEVPEFFGSQPANTAAAFYRPNKSTMRFKKPRIEVADDDDYLVVPDLG